MGKTKKNNKQIEEPKSKKNFWAGMGLAGLVLAAGAGITASCYDRNKEENTAIKTSYEMPIKERWSRLIDNAGVFLFNNELEEKYEVFKENAIIQRLPSSQRERPEQTFNARLTQELKSFEKNTVPEKYNEYVFYNLFATNHGLQALIAPDEVVAIFDLPKNPVYAELLNSFPQDDFKMAEKMLSCAVIIVHKKLTRKDDIPGDSREKYLQNLIAGVGDCSDYTYSIASLYYTICHSMKRDDLASKIRIMTGVHIKQDGKLKGYHNWVQLMGPDEKWHDLEMNADQIGPDDPVSMSTQALYIMHDPEGGFQFPLFSTTAVNVNNEYQIRFRAHVLPQDKK